MKKGFTLIELLAVIIILAIVALIATPIILDVVEDARKSAAKSEASMILSGIQSYCATEDMKIQMGSMEDTAAKCSGKSSIAASDVSAMANLGNASVSPVTVESNGTYSLYVKSNGYLIQIYQGVIPESYTKTTGSVPASAPTSAAN